MNFIRKILRLFMLIVLFAFTGCFTEENTDSDSGGGGGGGSSKLSSIQITKPADKIFYNMGEEYNPAGLEVTATYHSGKQKLVQGWTTSGFDSSVDVQTQVITVTYKEGEESRFAQYEIHYTNLTGIQITNPVKKLTYNFGDSFDPSGLVITANYKDGSSKIVPGSELRITGFDSSVDVSNQTITITYTENGFSRYAQFDIRYANASELRITNPADKLTYKMGDSFKPDGLVVSMNYKDGSTKNIPISQLTFSGFDSNVDVSNQIITVTYTEKGISRYTQYEIRYANASELRIVNPADKIIYKKGDPFEPDGLKVVLNYKDGSTKEISNDKLSFSGFDSSVDVSNQTITITYTEENGISRYTQYEIRYATINGISVTTLPRALKYRVGIYKNTDFANRDFMNLAEMQLTITHADGSNETFSIDELCKLGVNSGVLIDNMAQMKMVEFLNSNAGDRQWQRCTRYSDTPSTKEIYTKSDKTAYFVLKGFAFIKEEPNPQISIEYTEDYNGTKVTRTGSFSVSYDYTPTYEFTAYQFKKGDKIYYGDYPQSEKADDVIVCSKNIEKGMFKYYAGSDGNYYVKGKNGERYFKVEPIEWVRYNSPIPLGENAPNYLWSSAKILDGGIKYYPAVDDVDRVETDMSQYRTEDNSVWYRAATYNYHYNATCYQKSLLADFLNGTNESGLGLYNGKGFYQTAFTDTKLNGYIYPIEIKENITCDGYWYDTHVDGSASNLTVPDDIVDKSKIRKPYYQNVVPYYYDATDGAVTTHSKDATDYASFTSLGGVSYYYCLPMLDGKKNIDFRTSYYYINDLGTCIAGFSSTKRVDIGIAPAIRPYY